VQDDAFRGDDEEREALRDLVREVWDEFCSGQSSYIVG
jgi:hypothetical protein